MLYCNSCLHHFLLLWDCLKLTKKLDISLENCPADCWRKNTLQYTLAWLLLGMQEIFICGVCIPGQALKSGITDKMSGYFFCNKTAALTFEKWWSHFSGRIITVITVIIVNLLILISRSLRWLSANYNNNNNSNNHHHHNAVQE